ncbi:hypothetical protein PIB30_100410, partial [Stylosanthes scabra]|nr:hypothetical protein [Stylosanthes scabra]
MPTTTSLINTSLTTNGFSGSLSPSTSSHLSSPPKQDNKPQPQSHHVIPRTLLESTNIVTKLKNMNMQ